MLVLIVYIRASYRYFTSKTVREVVDKTKVVTRVAVRFIIVKTELIVGKTEIATRVAFLFTRYPGFDSIFVRFHPG